MPSTSNSKPLTPAAPNDMTIADSYARIDEFINKNAGEQKFKVEDDNHGMGMISTVGDHKKAVNMRLDGSTIRNYLINNGFQFGDDSICSRK
ncbi:hypothetical protein INT47_003749 [Mucor saturninus]|uniref:Uncharacterized protein n=1 Tax=Mucor saturninus TaxID=64648 RepID=A0A8H7R9C1_9FUNG|nr:hypothetical protein INT47_003749 [Mucor saturninus]